MAGLTEKEKMLLGQLYYSNDPVLKRDRDHAISKTRAYHNLPPEATKARLEILENLLGSCEPDVEIVPPFHCDYGYNLHIGHHFYANTNCIFLDCAEIRIGNHVFLGPNVHIYTANHPLDPELRKQGLENAFSVIIEDDVWIGGGTIINAGITIGRGTTIGSGSVVTRNVPSHVLAAGNPCRIIRHLAIPPRNTPVS